MKRLQLFIILLLLCTVQGCEQEIDLDLPEGEEHLVVEGHIENGTPPYVILSKDAPYFSETSLEKIENLFVHDAEVIVSLGDKGVKLKELTSADLPPVFRKQLANIFQIDPKAFGEQEDFEVSLYTTFDPFFYGQKGKSYCLHIKTPDHKASAKTTIPPQPKLKKVFHRPVKGNDSMVRVFIQVSDPEHQDNYYRYFTKRNSEPFFTGYFASVSDDDIVNGTTFNFPLDRGAPRSEEINEDIYSYFWKGDTVVVKFCNIDKAHYEFWNTLEEDFRNQGSPFGSATIVKSNVNGALGVWGGYSCVYDSLIISE